MVRQPDLWCENIIAGSMLQSRAINFASICCAGEFCSFVSNTKGIEVLGATFEIFPLCHNRQNDPLFFPETIIIFSSKSQDSKEMIDLFFLFY
jgi:hypothetical protein